MEELPNWLNWLYAIGFAAGILIGFVLLGILIFAINEKISSILVKKGLRKPRDIWTLHRKDNNEDDRINRLTGYFSRMAGDSSTDAPPPAGDVKKKRKGK